MTDNSSNQQLMTSGSIPGHMLRFTAGVFAGSLFQQLYTTADALIVGNMLGNHALASVSATTHMVFLFISLFVGVSSGAGVAISRFFGAEDKDKLESAIHTDLAFSLAFGVLMTVLGVLFTPGLLRWMDTPEELMDGAVRYVRIYFAGGLTVVMYNCFRGIMQALGDSRDPLKYLIISSVLNVVLDISFIVFFNGGVGSAALATVISQLVSALLCLRKLMSPVWACPVVPKRIRFDLPQLRLIIRYGLPAGLQNSVIGFANVVVQSNINAFGAMAVAGCGAYGTLEGFAFLPITSFVIALTTFVSQNLGAREYDRAKRGAIFGVLCALIGAEIIGACGWLLAKPLISAFTREPAAVAYGVLKMRTITPFYCLLAASHSFAAVLRGAGKSMVPMAAMLLCWCVFRVAFLTVAVPIYNCIDVVNWVYPITWAMTTVGLGIYLLCSDWLHGFDREQGLKKTGN